MRNYLQVLAHHAEENYGMNAQEIVDKRAEKDTKKRLIEDVVDSIAEALNNSADKN